MVKNFGAEGDLKMVTQIEKILKEMNVDVLSRER